MKKFNPMLIIPHVRELWNRDIDLQKELGNYYNKAEVDALVDGIDVDLDNYDTSSEVDSKIDTAIGDIDVDLSNYYDKAEVDSLIDGVEVDNLLFEYVHSGNKEVYIDSIDYDTNTFTSVGHGLVAGDRLGLNLLKQIDNVSQSPFTKLPVDIMFYNGFLVVDITADTFKIAIENASIDLINESTVDLSFFRFEVVTDPTILTFSEINANDIEVKVVGGFATTPTVMSFKGEDIREIGFSSRTDSFGYFYTPTLWSLGGTYSISFVTNDKEEVRQSTWNLLQFNPMFNSGAYNEISYRDNTQNSLQLMTGFLPYNGTTVKIYKL